jgi:hypothetical protein
MLVSSKSSPGHKKQEQQADTQPAACGSVEFGNFAAHRAPGAPQATAQARLLAPAAVDQPTSNHAATPHEQT